MVLVDADAVKAKLLGVLELVHVFVVHGVGLDRVEQAAVDVDPDGVVRLPEVVGQVRPRHQVEPGELHGLPPSSTALADATPGGGVLAPAGTPATTFRRWQGGCMPRRATCPSWWQAV